MILSYRPLSSKFLFSAVLITFCGVVFLYRCWHFGERPVPLHLPLYDGVPKKIWYKLGPSGLSNDSREWTDSCINANPNYQAEFMTDDSADAYVANKFASRPELVETYSNLTIPILKADLLRYLLLFDQGGIWSDLDISCEGIPIDQWIPPKYKSKAGLVVGWEFDVGWDFNFVRQFASWTILAKPGLPHMLMVIEDILEGLHEKMAEHNVPLAQLTLDKVGDVVDITGPRRLTRSVLKSLEKTLNTTIPPADIAKLLEPKLVGDVLIMPGYSFAASSNKYGEGEVGPPLVTHHYAGTWKNDYGGEQP